jgi:LysR family transcriptional regulator, glycine cleavage system transcriptional activator
MKRTLLPLNALRVFDATARHLSFTRAADELAVTPAAVGQQIRALEDMLGVVLFRRTAKGLELTVEADSGLPALRQAFLMFEESVRAMQSGQSSQSLTIAAPRDFAAKWLAPRLARHAAANPDLQFTLITADTPMDFTEANLDAAIIYAKDAGGHEGVPLASGAMVRVGAPDGGASTPISWPGMDDVLGQNAKPSLRLGDAGLAIDAAAAGMGVAHVPLMLAQADLDSGRVRMIDNSAPSEASYWLVAPLPQWRQAKVKALVAELTAA